MKEGKSEFYKKAKESLIGKGYVYYDGDKDIQGKGTRHAHRPDYIATKNGIVVIGEIKSPKEGPKSTSWRIPQRSDGDTFRLIRLEIVDKEALGELASEIGGHEIIIRGQIPDYVSVIGIDYDLPFEFSDQTRIMLGYTVPISEASNVESALKKCNKSIFEKIDNGQGSVTYIFNYQGSCPSTYNQVSISNS